MSKRKILMLAVSMCMVAILAVGGTLAYLTDTAGVVTNTFTSGLVDIDLDEAVVESDENDDLVATEERTEEGQEYDLHPAMTVDKDPTITVAENSRDAYVGAIVTIKSDADTEASLYDLIGIEGSDNIDIHGLASGGLLADQEDAAYRDYFDLFAFQNANYAVYQKADKANETWTLYVFMIEPMSAGEDVVLFEQLNIPETYDNDEMAILNDMSIEVEAFAAQADGFDSCYEALTAAFTDWAF